MDLKTECCQKVNQIPLPDLSVKPRFAVGSLESLIFGPMSSGKSTELLRQLTTWADLPANPKFSVLYVNTILDDRKTEKNNDDFSTHNSTFSQISSKIVTQKTKTLSSLDISQYDVIGVDEAQFFGDLVECVSNWVLNLKKIVYVASLDGNFEIKTFGEACKLIALCKSGGLRKLSAHCVDCLSHGKSVTASFTGRLGCSTLETEIGGLDQYRPLCLECHQQLESKKKESENNLTNSMNRSGGVSISSKDPKSFEVSTSQVNFSFLSPVHSVDVVNGN